MVKKVKSISLQNFTEACNLTNEKKYVNSNTESDYFSSSDERIYIDLRASYSYTKELEKLERNDSKPTLKTELKNAATKKYRLRDWGYSLGEYLYILVKDRLTLQHKTYSITSENNDFE